MREIVHLQFGQCGNQIGSMFWEKICTEHGIDVDGNIKSDESDCCSRTEVYFNKINDVKYVPRAIIVDLENATGETIRNSNFGQIFRPDDFINGINGAGNNFAKGFYTEGGELVDKIMEQVRKHTEECESLQGFQIAHSCGGGTGSGLGSRIISSLKDDYSDRIISTFTVFPSPKVSDVVVEPYNATLSLNHLIESASNTFCLDNDALYNICQNTLKIQQPNYRDLNIIVSNIMCGITSCVRFPGQLNSDLRKLAVNLTPFPRLHFFISSIAPLSSVQSQQFRTTNVAELVSQMFDNRNMMAACDPLNGKYFAVASIFRGKVSIKDIEDQMFNYQKKNEKNFVSWIPSNILTASSGKPPIDSPISSVFIGNTTAIISLPERVLDLCNKMLDRKAFLHWYTDEGMDAEEITESINLIKDLINEYKSKDENE